MCAQTYKNLEIILVNGGSEDESGNICDRFAEADERIKVIHKKNNGVSAARNSGIEAASGDWICFVDGDDFIMLDYVSYMLVIARCYGADISLTTQMLGNFDEL